MAYIISSLPFCEDTRDRSRAWAGPGGGGWGVCVGFPQPSL